MRNGKFWLMMMVLIIMLISCSRSPDVTVALKPEKPVAGEGVTVIFKPRRLVSDNKKEQKINLIAQLKGKSSEKSLVVPMNLKGDTWHATLQTDTSHCLLSVKFEDALGRVEDHSKWGWNFVLYNGDQKTPHKNGYFFLGKVYLGESHPGARPDFERAKQTLEKELKFYPENYPALFELWQAELATAINQERKRKEIARNLDSLKSSGKKGLSFSSLEFETAFRVLNDLSRALIVGREIVNSSDHSKEAERVRYAMAFLAGNGKRDVVLSNLEDFIKKTTSDDYRKSALRKLADEFQRVKNTEKAIQFYREFLNYSPDDVPVMLTLATQYLKVGNIDESQKLIDRAKKANNSKHYLQTNPWMRPSERAAEQSFNLCHILSVQADVLYRKNDFSGAIKARKESVEKGSLFPAFEWEKIGDIYRQIGEKDSAMAAYCRAIAINQNQQSAIDKVRGLFADDGRKMKNFKNFLAQKVQEQLKLMSRQAPDCQLTELGGSKLKIADLRGKVVLVSFWDVWSDASRQEIFQLNHLKSDFAKNPEVEFLAVSVETPVSVRRYVRENPFHFRLFHSGYDAKEQFGVIGFPSHFLIDPEGKIRFQHIGFTQNLRNVLQHEINMLLSEKQDQIS
ncbi:hypothetical protein B6D60_05865 [candidate division KSB1 bacterium 4484_87]|nr:MAG: hypothetical protein B6D60_05865 [candidate division KSB1 bacterium 4484_87]